LNTSVSSSDFAISPAKPSIRPRESNQETVVIRFTELLGANASSA
jgi:hypothetical protein